MTREELDFIGSMNMCDEISNDAYKKIVCHCEEQEPCEDCISRQAVLDAMYELCDTGETLNENPWRDNPHIDAIADAINNLPPVTPQPKTGHWIEEDMFDGDMAYICSECDEPFCLIDGTPTDNMYNFCPNCGAKMESEDKK